MKYWLIFMLFDMDGEFIRKEEYRVESRAQCDNLAAARSKAFVNKQVMTQSWCVTDDHHSGRKQDKGIPYD